MNLLPVAILAYLLIGIDLAIAKVIGIGPPDGRLMSPRLVIPLLAYVALYAPPRLMLWVSLVVGLVWDLLAPETRRSDPPVAWLVGPHAIGYLAGMYSVIVLRGYMIKRSVLTLPVLSLVASLIAMIVTVAILSFRAQVHSALMGPEGEWHAGRELWTGTGSALYTAAVAFPLVVLLRPLTGVMGLEDSPHRRRTSVRQ